MLFKEESVKRVIKILSISTIFIGFLEAKFIVTSSISPISSIIKKIGGDEVEVLTVVKAGASPHTYEPKVSQMIKIEKSKLYFAIGVEFEKVWLNKFKNQNNSLKIIKLDENISKIKRGGKADPHIWLSPSNLLKISEKIFKKLSQADLKNRDLYKLNYQELKEEISELDKKIVENLSSVKKGSSFMVFHPSWGYFAKEYGLKEIAVEINGKKPKPSQLIKLIKRAKEEKIKALIAQPEFSTKSAEILANELKVPVIKLSPLSPNWKKTLESLSKAISR